MIDRDLFKIKELEHVLMDLGYIYIRGPISKKSSNFFKDMLYRHGSVRPVAAIA